MKEERKISGSELESVTENWERRYGNVECCGRQVPKSSSKTGDKTDVSSGKEMIFLR
jgi:hypothetical protein